MSIEKQRDRITGVLATALIVMGLWGLIFAPYMSTVATLIMVAAGQLVFLQLFMSAVPLIGSDHKQANFGKGLKRWIYLLWSSIFLMIFLVYAPVDVVNPKIERKLAENYAVYVFILLIIMCIGCLAYLRNALSKSWSNLER